MVSCPFLVVRPQFSTWSSDVLSFASFDSKQDGSVALFTPHTGFSDPSTPEGTPFRQSIELRALVFYD